VALVISHLHNAGALAPSETLGDGEAAISYLSRLPKLAVEQQKPAIILEKRKATGRRNRILAYGPKATSAAIEVGVVSQTFECSGDITHIHSTGNEPVSVAETLGAAGACQQTKQKECAKTCHIAERSGSGTPAQWCPIVNRDAIPALPAAGLLPLMIASLFRQTPIMQATRSLNAKYLLHGVPRLSRDNIIYYLLCSGQMTGLIFAAFWALVPAREEFTQIFPFVPALATDIGICWVRHFVSLS